MDGRSLACELVRARADELEVMRNKIEKMNATLDKLLRVQLELLSIVEEHEERNYALAAELGDGGIAQNGRLSFRVLFEMAISRLKG
ncbi:hypothetical protein L915_10211 [Phytophthora nicotianae]|uniref:Uncharacterized protein n=1 Tax=Phytophthora nicotianae TaxID=4792 RepID=W2GRE1_PHYNI|nr:hypothetical protein L915_10211 [Phytophthora nicotianae]